MPLTKYPFEVQKLPDNGIYFFYEEDEIWGHGNEKPRIVRIGTHKDGNFRSRIAEHFLLDERKMNFSSNSTAPHERSIFRKNIGRTLLANDAYLMVWEIDFTPTKNKQQFGKLRNIEKEKQVESQITQILRDKFSFRFIVLEGQKQRMGTSGLESRLIASIANCQLCKPSEKWLGKQSPKSQIRDGKMWIVQHLKELSLSPADKEALEVAIRNTLRFLSLAN